MFLNQIIGYLFIEEGLNSIKQILIEDSINQINVNKNFKVIIYYISSGVFIVYLAFLVLYLKISLFKKYYSAKEFVRIHPSEVLGNDHNILDILKNTYDLRKI